MRASFWIGLLLAGAGACVFDLQEPPEDAAGGTGGGPAGGAGGAGGSAGGIPSGTIDTIFEDDGPGKLQGVAVLDGTIYLGDDGEDPHNLTAFIRRIEGDSVTIYREPPINGMAGLEASGNSLFYISGVDTKLWEVPFAEPDATHDITMGDVSGPCVTVDPVSQRMVCANQGQVREVTGQYTSAVLVDNEADPVGVALAADHLYWINDGDGALRRADPDGANPETLWEGPVGGRCMTAHDGILFWANENGMLYEYTPGDTEPQLLTDGQGTLRDLAVDDRFVYFTTTTALKRLAR